MLNKSLYLSKDPFKSVKRQGTEWGGAYLQHNQQKSAHLQNV